MSPIRLDCFLEIQTDWWKFLALSGKIQKRTQQLALVLINTGANLLGICSSARYVSRDGTYLKTDSLIGAGPYKYGRQSVGYLQKCWAGPYRVECQCYSPVRIKGQFQQLALFFINMGTGLSSIYSSVGLGAGLYGVGRQCYNTVLAAGAGHYKHGRGLSCICSTVGLGAGSSNN